MSGSEPGDSELPSATKVTRGSGTRDFDLFGDTLEHLRNGNRFPIRSSATRLVPFSSVLSPDWDSNRVDADY